MPNLKRLRDLAALTQEDLAWRAGITREQISRFEHGAAARHSTVRKLALALNCEPSDLQATEKTPALG